MFTNDGTIVLSTEDKGISFNLRERDRERPFVIFQKEKLLIYYLS